MYVTAAIADVARDIRCDIRNVGFDQHDRSDVTHGVGRVRTLHHFRFRLRECLPDNMSVHIGVTVLLLRRTHQTGIVIIQSEKCIVRGGIK